MTTFLRLSCSGQARPVQWPGSAVWSRMADSDEESGPVNFSEDISDNEDEVEGDSSFKITFPREVFSGETERGGGDVVTVTTPLD